MVSTFNYNKYEYNESTVLKLIEGYKKNLLTIINHCAGKEEAEISPSDLDYNGLSIDKLEEIENRLNEKTMHEKIRIKNIYPLAPIQAGMLFSRLMDKESEAYFEQIVLSVNGKLYMDVFEKSFNILLGRYDILRTVFIYEELRQPLQVVLKDRQVNVDFVDISDFEEKGKISFIEQFRRSDRKRGFDLSKDILMRVAIIQTDTESYDIIWSFHHIVMDGWSLGIIINEVFNIYQSLKENKLLNPATVYPYSNYIRWLGDQDKEEALSYWKKYLEDYKQRATLPVSDKIVDKKGYKQEEVCFKIDKALTIRLETITRNNQVTLNTVFQSIWGILLQKYNNVDDIVFGSVVSGRPPEIAGVENMVGLFINTIPIRIKCEKMQSFSGLLKQVQESLLLSQRYCYFSLAEIQSNTALKQELIDSIMVFENFPVVEVIGNISNIQNQEFIIRNVEVFEQTNYNFNIIIGPGTEIEVSLKYNALIFDKDLIDRFAKRFINILQQIVEDINIKSSEIEMFTERKTGMIHDFNEDLEMN